jgi:hypothetical protein
MGNAFALELVCKDEGESEEDEECLEREIVS